MKQTFSKILRVVTTVLMVVSICIMLFTVVSVLTFNRTDRQLFGYRAFIVLSDSMSATDFSAGDLVLTRDVDPSTLQPGDIIALDPRTVVTESGYIKSRFLDDKLSAAILLGYAKYIRENNITPLRKVYQHMTVFEEVGHGACASIPEDVTELLSVDMGCVGDGLECTERQVSICAKDGHGPYNYQVTTGLVNAAKKDSIDYAVDIYPFYGSDADAALSAGKDARHGLIGAGVYASHGYERSHKDGVVNTFRLLCSYLNGDAPKMD